ncbi:MAG TPA: DUF4974 domain-containing protein [Planctomycetota bacterium]|nr:DUF4974 domain-containing protein [Planctomycetota bacterium]
MFALLPLLAVSLALTLSAAEPSLSEKINQAAVSFEEHQDKEFKPVETSLERWRKTRLALAIKDINDLLTSAAPADKPYLAYHLLSVSPRNKDARAVFTGLGVPAPFDDKGKRVPEAVVPTCRNRALVEKVSTLRYPPFSAVAEVVSPKAPGVQSYWKRQRTGLDELRKKLTEYAQQGEAATAYQVLAFYWPQAKEVTAYYASQKKPIPRQRTWFPSVDRYLLDNGLAGLDCLEVQYTKPTSGGAPTLGDRGAATFAGQTSWDFTENLRNCRVEGMLTTTGSTGLSVVDKNGAGAWLVLSAKQVELFSLEKGAAKALGTAMLEEDLAINPTPVQLEVRGAFVAALVGGIQVASADLPNDHAYSRFIVDPKGLTAQQLRVRFLGDLPETDDLLAALPAKPAPEEPWMADRKKQLDKPVSFKFEDTSVEEVVTLLSQLSGVKIDLDAKAETLKNLPVTLDGKDLKLSSALDWLQRVTDLSWKSTADGVQLTWSK